MLIFSPPAPAKRRNPWDYADKADLWDIAEPQGVTMVAQPQVPQGMVAQQPQAAPQPVQQPGVPAPVAVPTPIPLAPPAQPQPTAAPVVESRLGAPAAPPQPGAVETRVVAPGPTPPANPAERLRWAYERAGVPMPDLAPRQPMTEAEAYQGAGIVPGPRPATPAVSAPSDVATTSEGARLWHERVAMQRKQATNARFLAAGKPPPYPEAMPAPQAEAPPPPITLIPPEADPGFAKAASDDPVMASYEKRLAHYQKQIEDGGGKPTPKIAEAIAGLQKRAADRLNILRPKYEQETAAKAEEKRAKSEQDAATIQRSVESHQWAKDRHEAGASARETAAADKKRNEDMTKLLGAAQDAAKDGRWDDAENLAEAGQKNANTPAEAAAFNAVRREVQAARTTQAAAAMKPKVDQAETAYKQAQGLLNRAFADYRDALAEYRRFWSGTEDQEEAAASLEWQLVQELDAKIKRLTGERNAAQKTWEDLAQEHANIAVGIQARPQVAAPPPGMETTTVAERQPAPTPAAQPQGPAQVPTVATDADYDRLPSGTVYIAPDGTKRRKS